MSGTSRMLLCAVCRPLKGAEREVALGNVAAYWDAIPKAETVSSLLLCEDVPTMDEFLAMFSGPVNIDFETEQVWPIPKMPVLMMSCVQFSVRYSASMSHHHDQGFWMPCTTYIVQNSLELSQGLLAYRFARSANDAPDLKVRKHDHILRTQHSYCTCIIVAAGVAVLVNSIAPHSAAGSLLQICQVSLLLRVACASSTPTEHV
jgi:hypothetical protein